MDEYPYSASRVASTSPSIPEINFAAIVRDIGLVEELEVVGAGFCRLKFLLCAGSEPVAGGLLERAGVSCAGAGPRNMDYLPTRWF